MGPYTQQDPIGIAGGLNLYGYANGDPINFSDPFGLSPCDEDDDSGLCAIIDGLLNVLAEVSEMRATLNSPLHSSDVEFAADPAFLAGQGWQNLLHDNFDGFPETKWMSLDGREGVTDGTDGSLITTGRLAGSYNYVTPLPIGASGVTPTQIFQSYLGHVASDWIVPTAVSMTRLFLLGARAHIR